LISATNKKDYLIRGKVKVVHFVADISFIAIGSVNSQHSK